MNLIKIKKFLENRYRFQHTETALRYAPVVEAIKRLHLQNSKILEIGSGSTGITPYLKKNIVGVDVDFSGPKSDLVNKIKAKGFDLPFKKNSFNVAISVDVLEHINPELREKSITEMLRVSKNLAVIVVPCGRDSEKQDEELNEIWTKKFNSKNQFLYEHVRNGLPQADEILVSIDKSLRSLGKKAKIKSFPNLNLVIRNIIMRTWITNNKYLYYFYMKGYLPFIPILKHLNFGKTYRRVFVIEFEK